MSARFRKSSGGWYHPSVDFRLVCSWQHMATVHFLASAAILPSGSVLTMEICLAFLQHSSYYSWVCFVSRFTILSGLFPSHILSRHCWEPGLLYLFLSLISTYEADRDWTDPHTVYCHLKMLSELDLICFASAPWHYGRYSPNSVLFFKPVHVCWWKKYLNVI